MKSRLSWVPLVFVVCCLALVAGLLAREAGRSPVAITVPATSPASSPPVDASRAPFVERLRDPGRAIDLLIQGDATGGSDGSWVFLAAQALGQRFGRTVDLRTWALGSAKRYSSPIRAWTGRGAPITVWNASSSRNIEYYANLIDRWIPDGAHDIDVVLVSNGAVVTGSQLARQSIDLMKRITNRTPGATVVAVIQPVPPPAYLAVGSTSPSDDLRVSARINAFQTIDVDASFGPTTMRAGLFSSRLPYPNAAGYRRWSNVVVDALAAQVRMP